MNGTVDDFGRALITLAIRANQDAEPIAIQAWIDTAFSGELVIPRRTIEVAQLEQTAAIDARLADGKAVTLESFACILNWFDEDVAVEVIGNDGEYPLLGIGLLVGHRLIVDYTHNQWSRLSNQRVWHLWTGLTLAELRPGLNANAQSTHGRHSLFCLAVMRAHGFHGWLARRASVCDV